MRVKVREVKPPADTRDLDELVAEEPTTAPATRLEDGAPGSGHREPGPQVVHLVEHRGPLTVADLGPNGDVVLDLLSRAARLTADECRRLEHDAAWRWGSLALATAAVAPAVASVPVARAVALVRARREGRSDSVVALEAAVAAIMRDRPRTRTQSVLSACIANAGLAVLVRDLIDPETFEVLFGPWREAMHH
jgi:hypothetical protein